MNARRGLWMMLAIAALFWIRGCDCQGNNQPPDKTCVDKDGDQYGDGCLLGPDCDDTNPKLNVSCDCNTEPYQGCPCTGSDQLKCFDADKSFIGVGQCQAGIRHCESSKWGGCVGQILPEAERCDQVDNNCDGQTDEGLQCSSCGVRCFGQVIGPGTGTDFDLTDQNGHGLQKDAAGDIELQQGAQHEQLTFLWVANSAEGTVSKINTRTGKEEGRYLSALTAAGPRNRGHAPAHDPQHQNDPNVPSRTAVDFNGDVWVANRAFNYQGTVTKIANQDCPDINGNGKADTSSDVNGDGVIDINDPREFLGENDECILFTVDVGGTNGVPRALALDAGTLDSPSHAWVGLYFEQKFVKLSPDDGHVLTQVSVPLSPYGAAIDSHGILWTTENGTGQITSVDTNTNTAGPLIKLQGFDGSYGIAVDGKNRVWVGGYSLEGAARYNPADHTTLVVPTPGVGVGRGIAADADGYVWLAHSWLTNGTTVGRVTRFKADDGSGVQTFDFPDGDGTIGVGVDFDGKIWGVNQNDGKPHGTACRLDPASGQSQCFPVGLGPYTYSDFTGYALRNFTAPSGIYKHVYAGCTLPDKTRWKQLTWDATVPAGTAVVLYVRAADTVDALATATRFGPFTTSPADLLAAGQIVGNYLVVEVELSTTVDNVTPILKALGVEWVCGGAT